MLTVDQICEQLGIGPAKVATWIRTGELPGIDVSSVDSRRRKYRVREEDFAEFIAKRTTGKEQSQ